MIDSTEHNTTALTLLNLETGTRRIVAQDHEADIADFLDSHVSGALLKDVAIDSISIADQEPGRCIVRKCLNDLPCRPLGRWIGCDVEMDNVGGGHGA